ncbi:MAG: hypothetical protein WDN01_07415 [Rhizomicrobium sp.]
MEATLVAKIAFAELYRAWLLASREKTQFLLGCAILFIFYFGYHAGATFFAHAAPSYRNTATAYLSWMLVVNGMTYTSSEIERDITQGTFFRVMSLCGGNVTNTIAVRTVIGFAHSLILYAIFSAIFWAAGLAPRVLSPDADTLIILVHAALVGAGLGLAASGLAQVARPVQVYLLPLHLVVLVSSLLQFGGSGSSLLVDLLPLGAAPASPSGEIAFNALHAAIHAAGYLGLGSAFLAWSVRYSRRHGSALQV